MIIQRGDFVRKTVSILLIFLVLGTSVTSFASMEDKLGNHWSKGKIQKDFLADYFPYLAKNNFEGLDPNGDIKKGEFALSLASLYKDTGLDPKTIDLGIDGSLKREDILRIIGDGLKDADLNNIGTKPLPFKDINKMDNGSIELLRLLYNLEIIHGISPREFGGNKKLSQSEAIIILQRLKGVLKPMEEISFTTMGMMQSYNNEESIIVKDLKDKVTVTITKGFPTSGYILSVDKIKEENNGYKVHLKETRPKEDSMQLQVITYKTITIEINKDELNNPGPYKFNVEGVQFPSGL